MPLTPIRYPLTIIHKPGSHPYARWGGSPGVRAAKAAGATAIDIDARPALDGWAAVHGNKLDGLYDVPPELAGKDVDELTLAQLKQCKSKRGGFVIESLREVMATAVAEDMTLCVEVKSLGDLALLREDAEATGCRVVVMALQHIGGKNHGYEILAAAKAVGLPTMVLLNTTKYAAGQVPAGQWKHLDYVKGPTKWQAGRPARVIRLGAGSKYGISVTPTNARAVTARLKRLWGTTPPKPPRPEPEPPVMPNTAAAVIAEAKKHVGMREGRNNDNPFAPHVGFPNHQAWCASFVCDMFKRTGMLNLITTPSPGVDQLFAGFKRQKRTSEYPAIGAVVGFGSPRDLNHTGIVWKYDKDFIWTIEGNTNDDGSREGNGVYLKKRARRSPNVVIYGYPKYDHPIVSADPEWDSPGDPKGPKPWVIRGMDLSHHNTGRIDWAQVPASLGFVYLKATEHLGFRDDMYASRRLEVKRNRRLVGAYHFARPSRSSGKAQAQFFLSVAKPLPGELRPCLDLEDRGGKSPAFLEDWTGDFMAELRKELGKPGIIYDPSINLKTTHRAWLWTARYNDKNLKPNVVSPFKDWTIHQFSQGINGVPNRIPGVHMQVDINTVKPGFDVKKLKL